MGAVALRTLILLLAAPAALAHAPQQPAAAADWNTEAWLLLLLAVSVLGYALGLRRLWAHAGSGRGVGTLQAASFALGWLALAVALVTPLDAWGHRLFSVHMVQHELLMVVAAPLLVLGRPLATWTWALPAARRRAVGRWFQARAWARPWAALTDPLGAFALHAVALWAWHIPAAFDAALVHEPLHIAQHASFLATALFFWWSVLGHDPRGRYGVGHATASLFATMMHTSALGALLSLAPSPWYAPYVQQAALWGADAAQDQQLGGLIMWVPAALAYVVAALAVLGRVLVRVRA